MSAFLNWHKYFRRKKRGDPNRIPLIFLSPSPSGMRKVLEEGWEKDDQDEVFLLYPLANVVSFSKELVRTFCRKSVFVYDRY